MKTKKLETLEKYTSVAVRAKISVEVEQRKRLGAWGKRVLVLDGATLYAYKTKGDGGSVGGWAIGGADVHVRRNSDSNRDDGRHILVIARPPAYKLVFAFATVYEQARMIQALSSSGATVTGLDAIMLLKNLRQQQEQEQKEQEERERAQSAQTSQENDDDNEDVTPRKEGQDTLPNGDQNLENEDNGRMEEVDEIDESIYDQGTGTVSNPLYMTIADLSGRNREDQPDGAGLSIFRNSISTSRALDGSVSHSQVPSANQDPEDKVNPLPKPPRVSVSDGSHTTNSSSAPDSTNQDKHVDETEEASGKQSVLNSGNVQEDLQRDSNLIQPETSGSAKDHASPGQFSEEKEPSEHTEEDTEEDDSSIEGIYEFNPDPLDEQNPQRTLTEKDDEDDTGEEKKDNLEDNYVELVSKMKLERGLSIESQSGTSDLDNRSPDGVRRILGDSPLNDQLIINAPSPVNETVCYNTTNGQGNDKSYNTETTNGKQEHVSDKAVVSDDTLSDYDEKFEQLYRELSSNGVPDLVQSSGNKTTPGDTEKRNESQTKINSVGSISIADKDTEPANDKRVVKDVLSNQTATDENASPEGTPLKRVSSIIKRKDSPSPSKAKKVQFNLDATSIEPPTSSTKEQDDTSYRSVSLRKAKKEPLSPPPSASPVTTPSPTKKKGIFSNLFFSGTSKKTAEAAPSKEEDQSKKETSPADVPPSKDQAQAIKKDQPPVKAEASIKKAPAASQGHLKRQPTVDLTAPLVIGGSVEMGGSISGKLTPRRIEVRDGHVLAYMPKAISPTSRLSLVGLSVAPLMSGAHANSLSLMRASRCMMVIKLTSREEMMQWISVLSDEVIKLTPENQRAGLILYPSAKKIEPNKNNEKEIDDGTKAPPESKDQKAAINKEVLKKSQGLEKDAKNKPGLTNGHREQTDKADIKRKADMGNVSKHSRNDRVVVNGDTEMAKDEDTSDGWLRKNKQPVVEEFEMSEVEKPAKPNGIKNVPTSKSHDTTEHMNRQAHDLKVVKEVFKEDKESEKTVRKISKLNIEERWKELQGTKTTSNTGNSHIQMRNSDIRQHPPLRRLSAQENVISRPKSGGHDTVGTLLFVNDSPKHDYHVNCHPPLERLSNRSRNISASESNLRKGWDQKPVSNAHHLHRFGSELTLVKKPKKEFNNNTVNGTKGMSNVLASGNMIKNQVNTNKTHKQQERMSEISPAVSPLHNRYARSSAEPREVEIIEYKSSSSLELNNSSICESNEEDDQWYEKDEPIKEQFEESQDTLPGITWSVAATREKFELLCSVSGENKSGKLTTKNPISRKKSIRTSVKKRRSMEGGSGRRANARRSNRISMQGSNRNDIPSPSNPSMKGTPIAPHATSIPQKTFGDNSTSAQAEKPYESDTSSKADQSAFKLQPVRDRRRNFERDVTDSTESLLSKSSSVDSVNDANPSISNIYTTNEPANPNKYPLKRTQNILQATYSSSSSPEPDFITSKLINGRPKGNIREEDKGIVTSSLTSETHVDAGKDAEVVICWRGPYIAQELDFIQNADQNAGNPKQDRKELKEAEQAVLSNISNAFLAKRRLLAREVAIARIQEKLSTVEETIWDIQASMAEIDKQQATFVNTKVTNNWKALERSLRTAEEDMAYWTARLTQTQKEADQAREKLAAALVTGLTQYNPSGDEIPQKQRQQLLKRYTKRGLAQQSGDGDEDADEDYVVESEGENDDSYA